MSVHHTRNLLPNPNFAYQHNCLLRSPALSLLNVVLVFRPSSVPDRADVSQRGVYHT